jgi:hypothetical protein
VCVVVSIVEYKYVCMWCWAAGMCLVHVSPFSSARDGDAFSFAKVETEAFVVPGTLQPGKLTEACQAQDSLISTGGKDSCFAGELLKR